MPVVREQLLTVGWQYVIDIGLAQSQLHLRVATTPCLLGYGEVGRLLYSDPATKREGNPYWPWICEYNGEDFQTAVTVGRELLEKMVEREPPSPSKLQELTEIFRKGALIDVSSLMTLTICRSCPPRDRVLADGHRQVVKQAPQREVSEHCMAKQRVDLIKRVARRGTRTRSSSPGNCRSSTHSE